MPAEDRAASDPVLAPAPRADGEACEQVGGGSAALLMRRRQRRRRDQRRAAARRPPACAGPVARAARTTSTRARPLTSSVSTNSTSPAANSAERWVPGRLAELVGDHRREAVALAEQVVAEFGRVADQDRDGDRLADRPAQTRASRRRRCPSGSRGARRCGSSPSASRRGRAPPPCGRPGRWP